MRHRAAALCLALPLAAAGCATFPDVEDRITASDAAPYPTLRPLDEVAAATASSRLTGTEAVTLQGRADRLRARGASAGTGAAQSGTLGRLEAARRRLADVGSAASEETETGRITVGDAAAVLDGADSTDGDAATLARVEQLLKRGASEASEARIAAVLQRADAAQDSDLTDAERRLLLLRARARAAAAAAAAAE